MCVKIYINGELVVTQKGRGDNMHLNTKPVEFLKGWKAHVSDFMVFSRVVTDAEVADINRYINGSYIIKNIDWVGAQKLCIGTNQSLATLDDLCQNGVAVEPAQLSNAMAPIGGRPNNWVNLTTCKVSQHQGMVKTAHLKCFTQPRRAPHFDTVVLIGKNKIVMFKDMLLVEYNLAKMTVSQPMSIAVYFKGLPNTFHTNIEAAYYYQGKNCLYLTRGEQAVCYSPRDKKVLKQGTIRQVFPNIPDPFGFGKIDAITQHTTNATGVWLFKDNVYSYYNLERNTVSKPKPLRDGWDKLSELFMLGRFNGVIRRFNNYLFFKEEKFLDYSKGRGSETNIIDYFTALPMPFVTRKQRCYMINQQLRSDSKNKQLLNEKRRLCTKVSYQKFLDQLERERERLANLRHKQQQMSEREQSTIQKTRQMEQDIQALSSEIEKLDQQILQERQKECPKDVDQCNNDSVNPIQQIAPKRPDGALPIEQQCSAQDIQQVLKNRGYTQNQLDQLESVVNSKSTVSNYDIRQHRDFYKYVKRDNIKSCNSTSIPKPLLCIQ